MRSRRPVIMGLDLSLTSSAAVVIPNDWKGFAFKSLPTVTEGEKLTREATEEQRLERLYNINYAITHFVRIHCVTHVFVEQYAFRQGASQAHAIGELGGLVKSTLYNMRLPIRTVVASQARKFMFGKIPAKDAKMYVQQRLVQMGAIFTTEDEGDALVVANYGRSELDLPALSMAK